MSNLLVAVSKASKLLLACCVPDVEQDLAEGGEKGHGVDLDTESGNVFLLELASQVTLDEGSLADAAISDEDQLEFRDLFLLSLLHHLYRKD